MSVNWPGLLKWSLSYSDGTSERPRMSPEKMEFLKKAIEESHKHIVDPMKVVEEAAQKLNSSDNPVELLASLVMIEKFADEPEVPRNLHKLKAIQPLCRLLAHPDQNVSEATCQLLGLCLANNPTIQDLVHKENALPSLVNLVQSALEGAPTPLHVKALTCLSALLRHHRRSELDFVVRHGGASLLFLLLDAASRRLIGAGTPPSPQSVDVRLCLRAATLLRHLLTEGRVPPESLDATTLTATAHMLAVPDAPDAPDLAFGEASAYLAELVVSSVRGHPTAPAAPSLRASLFPAVEARLSVLSRYVPNPADEYAPTKEDLQVQVDALRLALDNAHCRYSQDTAVSGGAAPAAGGAGVGPEGQQQQQSNRPAGGVPAALGAPSLALGPPR